ncbi:hypothetical protein [Xanthomonas phage RTH11]|nr:hypothetical protein [Xanthomonas phage RTH11]
MSTAIVEPQIINTYLNLDFGLTTLQIESDTANKGRWEFGFALAGTPEPTQEDFYLFLHFADSKSPGVTTITLPYRLHVTTLACPHGDCIYFDEEIQLALMHAVMAEIDMKLRQVFYRQADHQITHARLTNIVGGEFARTRRARFLPR